MFTVNNNICRTGTIPHLVPRWSNMRNMKDAGKPDILATIQEDATMAGQETRTKKQGVIYMFTVNNNICRTGTIPHLVPRWSNMRNMIHAWCP
jgi:hypothetical protein